MKFKSASTVFLILLIAVLSISPFLLQPEGLFNGTDGQAGDLIAQQHPEYKPWIQSFWSPPSKEIESLLFGLQAALGAGVIGYVLGYFKGLRHKSKEKNV